jgi:hypothetical protein
MDSLNNSTLDNSIEKVRDSRPDESNTIINKGILNDFTSYLKENDFKELENFIHFNKNAIVNLLGKLKQDFEYFSHIRDVLEKMIIWSEDLIIYINNKKLNNEEIENIIILFNKIYELMIKFIQYNTNNSFLEVFLNYILLFLKKKERLSPGLKNLLSKHFSIYYAKIYAILLEKKTDYIDKVRDSKISIKILKLILNVLNTLDSENGDDIKILDLFNFLMYTLNNIFNQSSDILIDKVFNMIYKVCKRAFCAKINVEDINKISEIIINKMLEISKFKDDLRNSLDMIQQTFYVNILILCLRLFKVILKKNVFNEKISDKITRVLIELSFWDNSSILDLTCKILVLCWRMSYKSTNSLRRSDFEKILDFMFIRRFQTYYNFLGDSPESNIKLSVLEILTEYLNKLIREEKFLIIAFVNYDFSKIRYSLVNELFNSIQKYYNLNSPRFNYLKKLITMTYVLTFEEIYKHINNELPIDKELLKHHQTYSETWLEIIKQANIGYKKLNKKLIEVFEDESKVNSELYKPVAALLKYSYFVDINMIYDVIGQNADFSKAIIAEYINSFDFKGLDILKAYRLLVSTFKLSGESYVIYNIINAFTNKFFEDNKEDSFFVSVDEVCTLAYSILMLNTDLHDPSITERMTTDQFIKNNLKTGYFASLPHDYLKNIYKSIQSTPLKAANTRLYDYSRSEEIFDCLKSRKYYNKTTPFGNLNLFIEIANHDRIQLAEYPLLNLVENMYYPDNIDNSIVKTIYYLIWEDLFYNFMSVPYKFYENKDDNCQLVIEKVCRISQVFNEKENIDKLIVYKF